MVLDETNVKSCPSQDCGPYLDNLTLPVVSYGEKLIQGAIFLPAKPRGPRHAESGSISVILKVTYEPHLNQQVSLCGYAETLYQHRFHVVSANICFSFVFRFVIK